MTSSRYYLNTDLDLFAEHAFDELVAAFDQFPGTLVLTYTELTPDNPLVGLHGLEDAPVAWFASIESDREDSSSDPTADLRLLLDAVDALDGVAREQWDALLARAFDVGWEAPPDRPEGHFSLPNDLLARVVAADARLAATIYPPSGDFGDRDYDGDDDNDDDDDDDDDQRPRRAGFGGGIDDTFAGIIEDAPDEV